MNNFIRMLLLVVISTISIPIIGIIIGKIVYIILNNSNFNELHHNLFFDYPLSEIMTHIIFFDFTLRFVPFFFIELMLIKILAKRFKLKFLFLIFSVLPFYVIYGLIKYRSQFWQLGYIFQGNISILQWLSYEHKDLHFSISSLLSSVLFIWLNYKWNFYDNSLSGNI